MNDLIRPALYESFHRIWPVDGPRGPARAARGLRGRDRRDRALGRRRPGLRERRLPGQGPPPAPRSTAATCSPSSRPGPTGWSWPPTTTPVPARPEILVDGDAAPARPPPRDVRGPRPAMRLQDLLTKDRLGHLASPPDPRDPHDLQASNRIGLNPCAETPCLLLGRRDEAILGAMRSWSDGLSRPVSVERSRSVPDAGHCRPDGPRPRPRCPGPSRSPRSRGRRLELWSRDRLPASGPGRSRRRSRTSTSS